jgi:RNA polymerase sigma-70 factor (ECF subfamily)
MRGVAPNTEVPRSSGAPPAGQQADESDRAERFTALFRSQYVYVWGTLRRLGVKAADAEDVAHEVFVRIYEKFDTCDPSRPVKPWCFVFAYRAACDYRKLARHRVEVLEDDDVPSAVPTAEQQLESADDARLVRAALESIEFERRAVLVAFEMDDIPMKAIAEAMGIPLFTAYSRLRAAREDFRVALTRAERQRGGS